ncbi:MAG: hypothetical protein R3D71_07310 [Rickettsiales bacterium]
MKLLTALIAFIFILNFSELSYAQYNRSMSAEATQKLLIEGRDDDQDNKPKALTYEEAAGLNRDLDLDPNMQRQMENINRRLSTSDGNSDIKLPWINNNLNSNAGNNNPVGYGATNNGYRNPYNANNYVPNTQNNYQIRPQIDIGHSIPPPPNTTHGTGSGKSYMKNYMDFFCNLVVRKAEDANFCNNDQKKQVCKRFVDSPYEIKSVLNESVGCHMNRIRSINSDCRDIDTTRLDLMKRYWQDREALYTILFLPDMAINAAIKCASNN